MHIPVKMSRDSGDADQAIVGHHVGVEIQLDLGIQGNHLQGGGQVFDEQFAGFITSSSDCTSIRRKMRIPTRSQILSFLSPWAKRNLLGFILRKIFTVKEAVNVMLSQEKHSA